MFTKVLILFCALVAVGVNGDPTTSNKLDPSTKPVPDSDAQACIKELKNAKILDTCRNQSLAVWDPLNRGQQMGSIREMCCEAYSEIDCLMNATQNNHQNLCNGTKQGMLNHQRTMIAWWKKGTCNTIRYHNGACDPTQIIRFPFPQPMQVANCNAKIYEKVNHCEHQAKKDWRVVSTDNQYSKSVCCSQYQTNDCYVTAAQATCNATEVTQFTQYYNDMNKNISSINCTNYQYQSLECFSQNADFPPPEPPAAANCSMKIIDYMAKCSNKGYRDWKPTLSQLTGKKACCANWDVFDCLEANAKDQCTIEELGGFMQYYFYLAQTIVSTNCTDFGYHSKVCKAGSSSMALHNNWAIAAILMIFIYFLK